MSTVLVAGLPAAATADGAYALVAPIGSVNRWAGRVSWVRTWGAMWAILGFVAW
ncbi:hypothetical protein [Streptomyces sp. DSM 118878]